MKYKLEIIDGEIQQQEMPRNMKSWHHYFKYFLLCYS
jgi:hypothetical protein